MKRLFILLPLLVGSLQGPAHAADGAPKFIEYQGTVLDASGAPLAATNARLYKMEFRLWSALEGGTLIWSEQQFVNVFNGQFGVRLGEGQATTDSVAPQFTQSELSAAFAAKDRYLGITVVNPPAPKAEISPRIAILSAPYAVVANEATNVVQQAGSYSNMVAGSIAYSTQTTTGSATVALSLDKRVNLISAAGSGTTATLPASGGLKELVVVKTDATTQFVTVVAPGSGKINAAKTLIRLKVQGESVTLQNIGNDDWWIVKDSRDTTQVGTIIAYGSATPPKGYLACDGTSYLRTAHPDLFEAIGTTWGSSVSGALPAIPPSSPSSADTSRFNVPNLNSRFLRGLNPGSGGADEDAGARFALYAGGSNAVGSYQQDATRRHAHSVTDNGHEHSGSIGGSTSSQIPIGWSAAPDGENKNVAVYIPSSGSTTHEMAVTASIANGNTGITRTGNVSDGGLGLRTGTETRPDSAVVRYCIKY